MGQVPVGAGNSSFDLIDVGKFLELLNVQRGMSILDLACGLGHYSFELSKHVGEEGVVYAIDLWAEAAKFIEKKISEHSIGNITPMRADVSKHIPLEDQSIDLCLMATVLHDLLRDNSQEGTLKEVQRVIRKDGALAVIEFKVIDGPPGPPKKIRVDPKRVEDILRPFGFSLESTNELGPYTYLSIYGACSGPRKALVD